MKITLESTEHIARVEVGYQIVEARVWKGVTEGGAECVAFIPRIGVLDGCDIKEFERDLISVPLTVCA